MDEMLAQFKNFQDLSEYASAQYQTILELSRKIQTLSEENSHLQKVLEGSTPLLETDKSGFLDLEIPNEKIIAEIQLGILKQKAMSGTGGTELSLEESKKVELYSKILQALKAGNAGNKPQDVNLGKVSNLDLIKQLENLPIK